MSELKTRPTEASVAAFLSAQPEGRRADCMAIDAMMQAATGQPAEMWGGAIVGYGRYVYGNTKGKSYEWPVIGFSPRKNDLTLYLMPSAPGYAELLEKLGKHKTGKACLYLKKLADVDTDVLRRMIEVSVQACAPRRVR